MNLSSLQDLVYVLIALYLILVGVVLVYVWPRK